MKKITLFFLVFTACILTVNAQFIFPSIPGPTNVAAGSPVTIDLNDVANAAGVTAGQYASFTVTADWVAGGGGPWSSEAEIQVTTAAGVADVDPPTAGGASNSNATTLTFSSGLAGIYNPSVDGSLSITLGQSFGGSDADWSNISVTLEPFVSPPLPAIATTLNVSGCLDSDTFTVAYDASVTGIVWLEVVYDGNCSDLIVDTEGSEFDTEVGLYDANGFLIGSDDDGGTGTLSLFSASGLTAGTYYVAAGRFNVTFGPAFGVTTNNTTATGSLSITARTPPPPPPTTVATLTLAGCGDIDTYANAAFDAAVDGVVWIQLDYDGTCFAGTIDTEGSDFDTEIGLYDSNGLRVGNDDDGGTGTLSSFTEAGLAAGTYYIAAGGFNMVFNATDFDVTTTSSGTGNLVVNASTPVIPPAPTTVATLTLAGCDDIDTYTNAVFDAAVDGVVWIQLDYDGACYEGTIDTEGSDFDTEIGLYDSNGLRVGNNDDGGTGALSLFTEADLAAGTYYIAVGAFNMTFNATDFDVTTTSSLTGSLIVNASTPTLNTVDFCNLQFPFEATIEEGNTADVYAQVYELGITDAAGQGSGIDAWIGVSDIDATTSADFESADWTWIVATYNTDNGNNDEYQAAIGAGLDPGTYYYVSRFSVDGGLFTYGGINPGSSDGNFWDGVNYVSGELTVTPIPPPANDDCAEAQSITQEIGIADAASATAVPGTIEGATDSGLAAETCNGFSGTANDDVWYSFVALTTDVNITYEIAWDGVAQLYSGTCGALTVIDCADSTFGSGPQEEIQATGLTVGETYYTRIYQYSGTASTSGKSFDLKIWSPSVPCTADAGTLTADASPVNLLGATATISATPNGDIVVPTDYEVTYVLTSGPTLIIEDAGATPSFDVDTAGDYTIHTLVAETSDNTDPNFLDLSVIVFGTTTGGDVLGIVTGAGLCASLDVTGAPITVVECTADAGTLTADASPVNLLGATATISATPNGDIVVPTDYEVTYVLTSGPTLIIEDAGATPSFDVDTAGDYTIHTLVAETSDNTDPNFLDLSVIVFGTTTGGDVLGIVTGAGLCASLDVTGAPITVVECTADAGTLTADASPVNLLGATATISATPNGDIVVPTDYEVTYVLTSGPTLIIEDAGATPSFDVDTAGDYTIHTLVAETSDNTDPNFLDLSVIVFGTTTGGDVLGIVTGAGLCASLDVTGAAITVLECTADAGTLAADASPVSLSGGTATISATPNGDIVVPTDYEVTYVLTSGPTLIIEDAGATPSFDVDTAGDYTIHTLVAETSDNTDPNFLDLSVIVFGTTTGGDVLGIVTGAGLCASLDVAGAPITVTDDLSIDDNSFANVEVYPNPVKENLTLSNSRNIFINSISLYDVAGRGVKRISVNNNSSELRFNLSELSAGVYIMILDSDLGQFEKQIIKE